MLTSISEKACNNYGKLMTVAYMYIVIKNLLLSLKYSTNYVGLGGKGGEASATFSPRPAVCSTVANLEDVAVPVCNHVFGVKTFI